MKTSSKTNWDRLAKMKDQDIDTSDIPELGDDFFQNAELRGPVKKPVTLRLDADVLQWFKAGGKGYQTRINQSLRKYMETQHVQSKVE